MYVLLCLLLILPFPALSHILRLQIPFVRTNVPQALLISETMNEIWGTCSNPHDVTRSPGGSSGGEGALIAAGGSVLGLGSDIGGSIR